MHAFRDFSAKSEREKDLALLANLRQGALVLAMLFIAIPFAPGDTLIRTPSAANAWGGERPATGTLSERVVDYSIDATLDPAAHTIHGRELVTWHNRSALPVGTVYFHLYLNAFSGHASMMMQESHVFGEAGRGAVDLDDEALGGILLHMVTQGGTPVRARFVHPDGAPDSDETVVAFDLPQIVPPNGTTTLAIAFDSTLPKGGDRAGYYGEFYLAGQWFPKIGVLELPGERGATEVRWNVHAYHLFSEFYADFAAFDVRVTVPAGYQVAAVGERQGEPSTREGQTTFHFTQGDVHDFAWMAARDFAPPLHGVWRGHVAVDVYFPEEYRAAAERCLATTLLSLDDFSDAFFPYPYATVTCVVPPYGTVDSLGGMEYPTFFTTEGARRAPPHSSERSSIDFTTVHEFGHGYFYGIIASNEFEEPFLDEGLNEYWDFRFLGDRGDTIDYAPERLLPFGLGLHLTPSAAVRAAAALAGPMRDPLSENSWRRLSMDSYSSIYDRTAAVFSTLQHRLAPGELDAGMRAYVQRWRFRHPSVADLEQALAEHTTQPEVVHEMFARFVYETSALDDRVAKIEIRELVPEPSRDKTPAMVDAEIAAARKSGVAPYPFLSTVTVERAGVGLPQTLRVAFDDGSTESVIFPAAERWHRFTWVKSVKAREAQLDPAGAITIDSDKLNDGRTREPHPGALVALCRGLGTWLQVFFTLLVTS
jgi:hypothetical protein